MDCQAIKFINWSINKGINEDINMKKKKSST